MSEFEFRGTAGEFTYKPGPFGGQIYYGHGHLMSHPVIPVDDTGMEGESWLDMRERTAPEREANLEEAAANLRLLAASKLMFDALDQALTSMLDSGYSNDSVAVKAARAALTKATAED